MVRRRSLLLLAATVVCGPLAARAAEEPAAAPTTRINDNWITKVSLSDDDGPVGECRAWIEQSWLVVERRTHDGELEWKIVLAKVVGDEPPKIEFRRPGGLRVSYRDGRYFIRESYTGDFRCLREPKQSDETWPAIELPEREPNLGGAGGKRIDIFFAKRWCYMAAGPRQGAVDCLVRLNHHDLIEDGPLCGVAAGPEVSRGESGRFSVLDDSDLLVGERLADHWAQAQFKQREFRKKLPGSPAPELSGVAWFNTGGEPLNWKELKDNMVLLAFFNLRQPRSIGDLAALRNLHDRLYEKGLVVLGVQSECEPKDAEKLVANHALKFPVMLDDWTTHNRFAAEGMPSYFLVDREGKVVWGYLTSLPPTAEIEKLLEAK